MNCNAVAYRYLIVSQENTKNEDEDEVENRKESSHYALMEIAVNVDGESKKAFRSKGSSWATSSFLMTSGVL